MQVFVFEAAVTKLPDPATPMYESRTKDGDKVTWAWEAYKPPAAQCARRRELEYAASVTSEEEWVGEWQQRLSCWWEGLPRATQSELGRCLAAFGGRLASAFEETFGKSGASGASARNGGAAAASANMAEPGCAWVEQEDAPALRQMPPMPEASGERKEVMIPLCFAPILPTPLPPSPPNATHPSLPNTRVSHV